MSQEYFDKLSELQQFQILHQIVPFDKYTVNMVAKGYMLADMQFVYVPFSFSVGSSGWFNFLRFTNYNFYAADILDDLNIIKQLNIFNVHAYTASDYEHFKSYLGQSTRIVTISNEYRVVDEEYMFNNFMGCIPIMLKHKDTNEHRPLNKLGFIIHLDIQNNIGIFQINNKMIKAEPNLIKYDHKYYEVFNYEFVKQQYLTINGDSHNGTLHPSK